MTVGIVGLGAAGLRAAMLCEQAGATVRLFEAKGRVGGRLHTFRDDDAVYEAGGEWIDGDHHRCLDLLREFGLEPAAGRTAWPGKVMFRNQETTEAELWTDAMEDDLRIEAVAREMCRDLQTPAWKNSHKSEWDRANLAGFLAHYTLSPRGLWYTTARYRSDEGEDPERIGLLGWLTGFRNYLERDGDVMSAYRFPGGVAVLFDRILGSLRGEVELSRVLRRVRQDATGVDLVFEDGTERVDHAILTLPPPALERVVFEPALSVSKRCAIEACEMSRAIKIVWQFSKSWWQDREWGGSLICDRAIQQTWDGTLGDAPILTSYVCGVQAKEWTRHEDAVLGGLYELAQIFPEASEHFERGWVHDWLHDPYAGGAFSHLAPGYVLEHMPHIATPEGRVHFAGEHTATWTGFIEGAFESSERVVAEL